MSKTENPSPETSLVGDNQPRYTTKRLHDEIAKAKGYSRREALEDAARAADEEAEMWGYTDGSSARVVAERIRKLVGEDPTPPETNVTLSGLVREATTFIADERENIFCAHQINGELVIDDDTDRLAEKVIADYDNWLSRAKRALATTEGSAGA